ncbi:hypothetical protein [Halomicrobium urmianum]|uniref:hypothetical protein n=1 Tax=Halomicrobium urmianum TaxID=1586233 RepID=UPI001CD965D8|nr:hypothetical protein [Halomicrobium urmianum]
MATAGLGGSLLVLSAAGCLLIATDSYVADRDGEAALIGVLEALFGTVVYAHVTFDLGRVRGTLALAVGLLSAAGANWLLVRRTRRSVA